MEDRAHIKHLSKLARLWRDPTKAELGAHLAALQGAGLVAAGDSSSYGITVKGLETVYAYRKAAGE